MKSYNIKNLGDATLRVSVPRYRREAIMDALDDFDSVLDVELVGGWTAEQFRLRLSDRVEQKEIDHINLLIGRMADEEEKPAHHPILSQDWHRGTQEMDKSRIFYADGRPVLLQDYPEIFVKLPSLLSALEKTSHTCFAHDCQVCPILRQMGVIT